MKEKTELEKRINVLEERLGQEQENKRKAEESWDQERAKNSQLTAKNIALEKRLNKQYNLEPKITIRKSDDDDDAEAFDVNAFLLAGEDGARSDALGVSL